MKNKKITKRKNYYKKTRVRNKYAIKKPPSRDFQNPEYRKWRDHVINRDKDHCRWPGCRCTSRLQVHHIRRYADYPTLRYDVNNGITLCSTHHKMIQNREDDYINLFLSILRAVKKYEDLNRNPYRKFTSIYDRLKYDKKLRKSVIY